MARRFPTTAAVFVFALPAAAPAAAQMRAADDASIRQFVAALQAAWNARDVSRLALMYRPDADQIILTRRRVTGRAAIERDWTTMFATIPRGLRNTVTIESISPATPDVVVVNAAGHFDGRDENGNALPRRSDRATFLLTRKGPSWELASFRVHEAAIAPDAAAAVRKVIERTNASFERWYAAGQADSVAARYTTDAWQLGPNMPAVVTRDSIAAVWRRNMQVGKWQFTLRTQDVAVNGPVAVERGTYELRFTRSPTAPPEGLLSFGDHGNYVVHWVKEGGQWLLRWDIATSASPPAGTDR